MRYTYLQKKRYISCDISLPWTNFWCAGLSLSECKVEYQGQTRYTRILDLKPCISTCYRIGHTLELIFLSLHNFCSMLIEQLIDLRKVRTEKLKFRTDLRDWVILLVSNIVDDFLSSRLLKKSSKSKIEARPVKADHYITFKRSISICDIFGCKLSSQWIQNHTDFVSKHVRATIWSRCAVWFKSEQTPFPWTGRISFATDWAANFGCYRFRITPDIVSKLLRASLWSRCAVWFESEQTPFPCTGRQLRSAALHRIQFGTCGFVHMSYVYSETNAWSQDWAKR